MKVQDVWKNNLAEAAQVLQQFAQQEANLKACEDFTEILCKAYEQNANVFSWRKWWLPL